MKEALVSHLEDASTPAAPKPERRFWVETGVQAHHHPGVCMKITTPLEGQLWQLAVATLGAQGLEQLVAELLKSHVRARTVNMYGFLRLEWLGQEALEALRKGQRRAGAKLAFFEDDPSKVAILHCHSGHLLRGIVQTLPPEVLPEDLLEWRMQLDLGL
ncbi:hypothetical protein [Pseudomonas citri]|uniref:hypothetical protein n=1 Tax=Pseudomonas citri TaxID=2978349 RepID=UPI0021B5C2B5|nr:hypothetical protein [Pseudomonas citri]